jgi:hypothetical protein
MSENDALMVATKNLEKTYQVNSREITVLKDVSITIPKQNLALYVARLAQARPPC